MFNNFVFVINLIGYFNLRFCIDYRAKSMLMHLEKVAKVIWEVSNSMQTHIHMHTYSHAHMRTYTHTPISFIGDVRGELLVRTLWLS